MFIRSCHQVTSIGSEAELKVIICRKAGQYLSLNSEILECTITYKPIVYLGIYFQVFLIEKCKNNYITCVLQVQPGPPPCPVFYPEKQEITLPPDGLWVLRFPYAYVTERGPCFPPKENVQLMSYKVFRGVLKAVTQ